MLTVPFRLRLPFSYVSPRNRLLVYICSFYIVNLIAVKYNAFEGGITMKNKILRKIKPTAALLLAFVVLFASFTATPWTAEGALPPHQDVFLFMESALRDAIRAQLSGNPQSLTVTEAAKIPRLDLSGGGITSMAGIEHFWGLTYLNVSDNMLEAFDVPQTLELLETLNVSFNPLKSLVITRLDALTELIMYATPSLEALRMTNTLLEGLDLGKNGGHSVLTRLLVSDNNHLEYVNACFLPSLAELDASNNPELMEITAHNTALEKLNITNTRNLQLLNVNNTSLTSLNITGNPELFYLYASNTLITALNVSTATKLTELDVSHNRYLTSLTANNVPLEALHVTDNPRLESLHLIGNTLEDENFNLNGTPALAHINISGSAYLTQLHLSERPALATLNISNSPLLTHLTVTRTGLHTLNVSDTPELAVLYAPRNAIAQLSIGATPELTTADLSNNRLSTLDVRANTKLEALNVSDNILTSLLIANSDSSLQVLNATRNRLTSLDILGSPSLERLYISQNRMVSIHAAGHEKLLFLDASRNLLTVLQANDTPLTALYAAFNALPASVITQLNELELPHFQYVPQLHSGYAPAISADNAPYQGIIGEPYGPFQIETDPVWGWPMTWRLAAGSSLPPGLSLCRYDGIIYGTPAALGIFEFSIMASTAAGGISVTSPSQAMLITVTPPNALDIYPKLVYINDNQLSARVHISRSPSLPITVFDRGGLPENITLVQSGNDVLINAVRPASGQDAIDNDFVVTLRRGGQNEAFTVRVDLTPLPATEGITIIPPPGVDLSRVKVCTRHAPPEPMHFTAQVNTLNAPTDEPEWEAVTWSISGNTSSLTRINAETGELIIANTETAPILTVRAVSVADPTVFGTIRIHIFVPATAFGLTTTAGQRGQAFSLPDNTSFQPVNAIPSAADIIWTHVGGTAPDIAINAQGEVSVTGEGTVIVRGVLPGGENCGHEIVSTFTLTFSQGIVRATLHGLEALYTNLPAVGEVRFALEDAVFAEVIFPADFRINGLPQGLQAGTARRISDTLVTVAVTGTPLVANESTTVILVMPNLPARNIFRAVQPLPVTPPNFTLPPVSVYTSAELRQQRITFDLNPANFTQHRDISVQLLTNDRELRFIRYGNYQMAEETDFTLTGNEEFRIHASFLRQLPVGEWPLTFDMRRGASPELTLNIIDTRITAPPQQQPGAHLDMRLLSPPPFDDQVIFINGAAPLRISGLGLGSGKALVRPAMQNGRASLWVRADVLEYIALRHPRAVIEVNTRVGVYQFPTYLLDILRGAKAAIAQERLDYNQVYVHITLTDMSRNEQMLSRMQETFDGGQLLAPLVDLTVELIHRSSRNVFFTVQEFTRPLEWTQTIMPQTGIVRYGAFWFNPSPSRLEFAPHRANGANEVLIRSIFTGVHGVVNNGAVVTDISAANWGFNRAYTAANKGLIQVVEGRLSPNASITRAEFVQLLSFALQLPAPGFIRQFYGDVPDDHWAYDPITRARFAGLLDGEELFRPGDFITRQEMISMTAAAITRSQPVQPPQHRSLAAHFTDHLEIANHHVLSVQIALNHGIFSGFPDNTLRPASYASRLEAVSVVVALTELLGNID
jgi:hypothetical protein